MRPCCVEHCTSTDVSILAHRFPKQPKQAQKWANSLGITTVSLDELIKKYVVCTLHFKKSDYRNPLSNFLNTTAMPYSLWYNDSSDVCVLQEEQEDDELEIIPNDEQFIDDPGDEDIIRLLNADETEIPAKKRRIVVEDEDDGDIEFEVEILEIRSPSKQQNIPEYLDDCSSSGDDEKAQRPMIHDLVKEYENSQANSVHMVGLLHDDETNDGSEVVERLQLNDLPNGPNNPTDLEILYLGLEENAPSNNNAAIEELSQHFDDNNFETMTDENTAGHDEEDLSKHIFTIQNESIPNENEYESRDESPLAEEEDEGEFKIFSRKELIDKILCGNQRVTELENKLETIERAQAEMAKSMEAFKKLFNPGG